MADLRLRILYECIDYQANVVCVVDAASECFDECRIDLFEQWNDVVAHKVAAVDGVVVGGIGAVGQLVCVRVVGYFCAGATEQRAHDVAVSGLDAAQSVDAGAACQVHQHGFDVVVGVVGYGYGATLFGLAQLLEPCVAQVACGHFNRNFALGRYGVGVEVDAAKRQSVVVCQAGDKLGIGIGVGTAQMEIAVCHNTLITKLL